MAFFLNFRCQHARDSPKIPSTALEEYVYNMVTMADSVGTKNAET